jgi:hypothetical protein
MTAATRPRVRRRRWILALVCVVVVAISAVVVVVWRSIPDYRIAFLVDTSVPEASSAVAGAVGAAVQNTGNGDALSLRRFGGRCGDPRNTARVVEAGAGHAARISRSVRGLATGGSATLESGVLAAIKDFSGRYPFRGRKSNRIIVITSRGSDACTRDQAAVKRALQAKVKAAGLDLDFRFVGYLTPSGEQANLTQLASAVNAKTPQFAQTPADLTATLRNLVIPKPTEARPLKTPTPAVVPVLGHKQGPYQDGYGDPRPTTIFNGGDPTGLVKSIHWFSWGGSMATGDGTALYAPGIVADGSMEPAKVVAFNLGMCHGKLAYRAVEWYLPQHGGHFDRHTYINACTGDGVAHK